MASWLQDMYIQFEFSPKAAKLLIREQGLDSLEMLKVLTDKNIYDICNIRKNPGNKSQCNTRQGSISISHGPRKPEASCLPNPS